MIVSHSSETPKFFSAASIGATIEEKVNAFCLAFFDSVQYLFFAIAYLQCQWYSFPLDSTPFEGRVLCETKNFAKAEELFEYISFGHDPLIIDDETQAKISQFGISSPECIQPKPITNGHCFGNTALFLRMWLSKKPATEIVKTFKDGTPLEAAILQETYLGLDRLYIPKMRDDLVFVIDRYPYIDFEEEKKLWENPEQPEHQVLLEGLQAFLQAGNHPHQDDLVAFMQEHMEKVGQPPLTGPLLATVEIASDSYRNNFLSTKAELSGGFTYVGLKIEKALQFCGSSEGVLNQLPKLSEGAYYLSLPVYDRNGNYLGVHAIGVTVEATGDCLIEDSNFAIACCKHEELQSLIGEIYQFYTGLDFSSDFNGQPPTFAKWMQNYLRSKPNFPMKPPLNKFSLIKVALKD